MLEILIASHNKGKIEEFEELLLPLDIKVSSLVDYPELSPVEESGKTFEENAKLKAETIANHLQLITLADDSGLSVPILNYEPGVYSARYAGENANDLQNVEKLLKKMRGLSGKERQAYFTTVIAVAYPNQETLLAKGDVHGIINHEPKGINGFGYDPIFYYESDQQTFAQMSRERKNEISHRARAVLELQKELPSWLERLKNEILINE